MLHGARVPRDFLQGKIINLLFRNLVSTSRLIHLNDHYAQHKSFKTLVQWIWMERKQCTLGEGTDASRAGALEIATWAWPPSDQVRAWLEEGWAKWEKEEPDW